MANSYSALSPAQLKAQVQDFLNFSLVAPKICNTKYKDVLQVGKSVDFPYTSDPRIQDYTAGTDLTIDNDTAVSNSVNIDQTPAVTLTDDPISLAQRADKKLMAKRSRRAAQILGQRVDQSIIKEAVDNAASTVAGGTLSGSNIFQKFIQGQAAVEDYDQGGRYFALVDPLRRSYMTEFFVSNGFNAGDVSLRNGFVGKASGIEFYVTNNLPFAVTLTNDTQPTAGDTLTIMGVTWTCVADGTAANAGEVNIGADLADWKTIIVKALNGTTSSDYVDVSTDDRRKLQNRQLTAAAFLSDDCAITGFGKMSPTETFDTATNVFGTETGSCLVGKVGAPSVLMQKDVTHYTGKEAKRPETNEIFYQIYGKKVFYRDTFKLAKVTMNA